MNNCQYFTPLYSQSDLCLEEREFNINCTGVRTLPSGKILDDKFSRKDYHLIYLSNGSMEISCENKSLSVKDGCFVIVNPGTQIVHRVVKDECTYYWINFTGSRVKSLLEKLNLHSETVIDISIQDNILRVFHRIFEEFVQMDSFFETASAALLVTLLTRFARVAVEHDADNGKSHDLSAALTYINRNYNENISVEKLAAYVNISCGHFRRLFRETTGMTPIEYLTNLRLERACLLLSRYDISIKDVGAKVGFPEQGYFTRVFVKHYGIPPSKYRTINKNFE